MTGDTTFWIASCTKLITSIAALQCVERGQLNLDDDVSPILQELAAPDILGGFNEQTGEPILKKAQKYTTLRQLLTHSCGSVNDLFSPDIKRWREWTKPTYSADEGEVVSGHWKCVWNSFLTIPTQVRRYMVPILFEPGDGWVYGGGLDWAGRMVERVNGGIRLGEYMEKHIFKPLGMTSTGFRFSENEKIRANLSATTARTSTGELKPGNPWPPANPTDDQGGGGLYSSATDYIKVLISILRNDGTLLKPETVEMMFTPQLPDPKYLEAVANDPKTGVFYTSGVEGQRWNYGLGGLLNMEDAEGVCKKGTISWAGLPNLFWVSLLCSYAMLSQYCIFCPLLTKHSGLILKVGRVACTRLNYFRLVMRFRDRLLWISVRVLLPGGHRDRDLRGR